MTRIRSIQVLRALAVLGVMLIHFTGAFERRTGHIAPEFLRAGAFGVDLFFVVSGFIICKTAAKTTSAIDFLRKRFIRVAPLFYLASLSCLIAALLTGQFALDKLLTTMTFWPVWGREPTIPFLKVGWSLCFEAVFYAAISLAVRYGRTGAYALMILFTSSLALNAVGAGGVFRFIGNPLLLEFLAGVVIALTSGRKWPPIVGAAAVLAGLSLIGYRVMLGLGPIYDGLRAYDVRIAFLRTITIGPGATLVVWGALQLESCCKGALVRALGYLGDASYSTYLTHPLVIMVVQLCVRETMGAAPAGAASIVEYLVAICVGILTYEFVEKPLLFRLRRRPETQPVAVTA